MQAILASLLIVLAAAASPASAAESLADRLAPCLACPGEDGTSPTAETPSLGAQLSPYTLIQLYLFREKQRTNEIMNLAATGLTDEDLQSFSDAIAKLPAPKPAADPGDAGRMAKGKALTERFRCNVCHRSNFSGQENVPRLAAQREDYLLKTLRDYKSGARRGYDAIMAEQLVPIADADFADLAYYLARVR